MHAMTVPPLGGDGRAGGFRADRAHDHRIPFAGHRRGHDRPRIPGFRDPRAGLGVPCRLRWAPGVLFLTYIVGAARTALNPYCARGGAGGGEVVGPPGVYWVSCSLIPVIAFILFAVFATLTLSGALLIFLSRPRNTVDT